MSYNSKLSAVANATETTGTFYHLENARVQPIAGRLEEYCRLTTTFLKSLQAALYFGGGQPPRGDNDLWALQFRNNHENMRNLFYFDSTLVFMSPVNKTTWKYGKNAGVPHIFPWENPSKILLRYLVYLRSLEVALAGAHPSFCSDDNVKRMKSFVFQNFNQSLGTTHFTAELKLKTRKLLDLPHEGLGTANVRQASIFIGKRYVLPAMRDPDNGYAAIMDLQAGHSSPVAESLYGVEAREVPCSVTSNAYLGFKVVCLSQHHFYGIADHAGCKSNFPRWNGWNIDIPQILLAWV